MVYAKYVYTHCFKLIYLLIHCLISIERTNEKKTHIHTNDDVHVCARASLKINFNIQLYNKNIQRRG